MKTIKILNKVALAFAILSVIAFAVSIAPGVLAIILGVAAFVISLFGLIVLVLGGFVALLTIASGSGVWNAVFSLCSGSWELASKLFIIVPPMAEFCFSGMSQIVAGIGIGLGAVALAVSIVALSLKQPQAAEAEETVEPVEEVQTDGTGKKHKAKKKKTDRAMSITCLALGVAFTLQNVIALIVICVLQGAYFGA